MIYLLLGAAVLALVTGAGFWAYRRIFYGPGCRDWTENPFCQQKEWKEINLDQESFQGVSILSREGLTLVGRLYPGEGPVLLCVPDRGPEAERELALLLKIARHLGYAVLIAQPRCQGGSQGRTFSFGLRERLDVLAWVDFLLEQLGARDIFLYGLGCGGATVLMAGDFPLGKNIRGIIADSPYSTPAAMVRSLGAQLGWPGWLFLPLARLGARLFGGFDLQESSPIQGAQRAGVPILLLCGEADPLTPPQMSQDILTASPKNAALFTFPGAGHNQSCFKDPVRYGAVVGKFVQKNQRET